MKRFIDIRFEILDLRHFSFLILLSLCLTSQVCSSQIITTIAGNGTQGYSGDGGQAVYASLYAPIGVTFDTASNLYFSDQGNNCVRMINTLGIITTIAGKGTHGYSGDGGQAINAELSHPAVIVFDVFGNLYIADTDNHCIRMVNTAGIITTIAGNGTGGYSGDGGPATSAELDAPYGVTFDSFNDLYIADYGGNSIRKINTVGIISTIAGNGTLGFSGDGGQATAAELFYPQGVRFNAAGNLFITDTYNNRIRMINSLGTINTIIGNGVLGFSGDGGQATGAELYQPVGIIFDAANNLYFSDSENNRIRKVNAAGIISTIAGNGIGGYSGDGGEVTTAELHNPAEIAFDLAGNMYITDYKNNVIRKVTNIGQMGLQQFAGNNIEVTVYPNPASTSFQVTLTSSIGQVSISMYDVLGIEVPIPNPSQRKENSATIDVSSLQEGVYFIKVETNEGTVTKKVIKN